MLETKFKVLMHHGVYVNTTLLDKGIYEIGTPNHLYSKDDTIESLVRLLEKVQANSYRVIVSDEYFENLKQCELVEVCLTFNS